MTFYLPIFRFLTSTFFRFFKLFISLLEELFKKSADFLPPEISNIIQEEFEGEYSYQTTCKNCKSISLKTQAFNELELQVSSNNSLEECVIDYLKEEKLENQNQYYCEKCNSNQDAVREVILKKLPKTLNFQFLRFVFDVKKEGKKKLKQSISFPRNLCMKQFVPEDQNFRDDQLDYQLEGFAFSFHGFLLFSFQIF